jgi:hypothetical protein
MLSIVGKLKQFLKNNNLRVLKQPGDGNCLFHCFATYLNSTNEHSNYDHIHVRQDIIKYIDEHREGTIIDVMNIKFV